MDEKNTKTLSQEDLEIIDNDLATKPDYRHEFSEPFEWMGKTYRTLDFHFGKLKGKDALAIYRELQSKGVIVISPRSSQHYQMCLASRACGLGADAFAEMPLRDFEVILGKARNFIPAAALL